MTENNKKILLTVAGVILLILVGVGIGTGAYYLDKDKPLSNNNVIEDNLENDNDNQNNNNNNVEDEYCKYNTGNVQYNNELKTYCEKNDLNFSAIINEKELQEEFIYGFGENLKLNNRNDIRKISDNIILLWDNKTFFSNIKELNNDFKVRIFLEYMINGSCACLNKDLVKENYTHLFGEDVDYNIFNEYEENSLTDNFICACYGSGSTVVYEYLKEEQNDTTLSYYYKVSDVLYDENEQAIVNNIKLTFKLNNGYYNLVSIEKEI